MRALRLIGLWLIILCVSYSQGAWALLNITRTADGYIIPLSALANQEGTLQLYGADSHQDISLPLSPRLEVKSAELQLVFTNSISLLDISQLMVSLNGAVVAQFPLRASTPEVTARMTLPLDKLKVGYNKLGFNSAMHYTYECEDPLHPELWTKIDLERSFISVKANYKAADAKLSKLPDLIDRRLWDEYEVTLASAGSYTNATLEAGALIAQGAAMFRDYAPLRIKHAQLQHGGNVEYLRDFFGDINWAQMPAGDIILFGTRDELSGFLGSKITPLLNRPLYAVYPRPDDPTRFVLVITGQDQESLLQAAKTFALKNVLYPNHFYASPVDNTAPKLDVMDGIGRLKPDVLYKFSDLGVATTSLEGMGSPSMSLKVWLIPDPFAPRKDKIELKLYMSYGSGFAKQSVLNVLVNDKYQSTVPLDEPRGTTYMGYRVEVPVNRFKPGWNDIRLEAQMVPADMGGRCKTTPTRNLQVSIFDESNIRLKSREGKSFVPNLELISRSGLPFLHYPDGSSVGIYLPNPNSGTLAASWMMMSKLAQLNKAPLYNTRYYLDNLDDALDDNESVIAVAEQSAIPAVIRDQSPLDILVRANEELRVGNHVTEKHRLYGLAGWLPAAVREYFDLDSKVQLTGLDAALRLNADFSRESALVLMPNPQKLGRTLLLVTGSTGNKLANDVASLVQFQPWADLKGDVAVWMAGTSMDDMVRTAKISDEHATAGASVAESFSVKISQHPFWALAGLLVGLLLLTILTHLVLMYFQRKRS